MVTAFRAFQILLLTKSVNRGKYKKGQWWEIDKCIITAPLVFVFHCLLLVFESSYSVSVLIWFYWISHFRLFNKVVPSKERKYTQIEENSNIQSLWSKKCHNMKTAVSYLCGSVLVRVLTNHNHHLQTFLLNNILHHPILGFSQ